MFKTSQSDPSPTATSPGCNQTSMDVDPNLSQASPSAMEVDHTQASLPPAALPPAQAPAATQHLTQPPPQSGPDPHQHLLYFDVVIPNAELAGQDMVASYRQSLVNYMEELFKVDSTISLFPFGQSFPDESSVLKLDSTLGSTLSQLSPYFDSLQLAHDAYPPLFVSIFLGFDSDKDIFVPNCQAQLNGIGAWISHCPLQEAKVSSSGWIFGTHGDTDPTHVEPHPRSFGCHLPQPQPPPRLLPEAAMEQLQKD